MRPLHKRNQDPGSPASQVDRRRQIVGEMIVGIECAGEGSLEFGGIQRRDHVVTPGNADSTVLKMRALFGRDYPDLFPDMTALELSASEPQRTSEAYKYPQINTQVALERAWTGQPNSAHRF